jgi:uncharacterized damage-inducible protein DinB
MSSINPYASLLGSQDPLAVIANTAQRLGDLTKRLDGGGLERSLAPGKWTAREILCHLADTELAFAFRLRQTLAEPHHVIQPFDQDAWAKSYSALAASAADALSTFSAIRSWNIALLKSAPAEAFSRPVTHPERGTMTFQDIVATMGGHDLNHLGQLETIAQNAGK